MVIAMIFRGVVDNQILELVVLCDYRENDVSPACRTFLKGSHPREEELIFRGRNRNESIHWSQLAIDAPTILQETNSVQAFAGGLQGRGIKVLTYFEQGIVPGVTASVQMFSLKFNVTHC